MSSTGVRDQNSNDKRIIKGLIQNESQFIQSLRVFANTSTLSGLGSTGGEINNSPKDPSGNYLSRLGDKMLGPLALSPPLDFRIKIDANNTIDIGPLNDNSQYTSNVQLDSIQPNSFVLHIIAGAAFDGQILVLRTFAPTTPFTISQGTLGNGGNIQTGDGNDLTVGDLQVVALIFDEALKIETNTGGSWRVLSVSSGSGGVSGANVFLSNLSSPTAVNVAILPGTTNTLDFGSELKAWRIIHARDYEITTASSAPNSATNTQISRQETGTVGNEINIFHFNAKTFPSSSVKADYRWNIDGDLVARLSRDGAGIDTFDVDVLEANKQLVLQSQAVVPAINGIMANVSGDVKVFSGGVLRNLSDIGSGGEFFGPWTALHNAGNQALTNLNHIQFNGAGGAPSSNIAYINAILTGMVFNVPGNNTFSFDIVGAPQYTFSATQADFKNNNLTMGTGEIIAGGATKEIRNIGELVFVNNTQTPAGNGIFFFDGTDLKAKTGSTTVNLTNIGGSNFTDAVFRVTDETILTKKFAVDVGGNSPGATATLLFGASTNITLSFPNATTIIPGLSTTQTFSGVNTFSATIIAGGDGFGMNNIGHLDFVTNTATPAATFSIYSDGTDLLANTGSHVTNFDALIESPLTFNLDFNKNDALNINSLTIVRVDGTARLGIFGGTGVTTQVLFDAVTGVDIKFTEGLADRFEIRNSQNTIHAHVPLVMNGNGIIGISALTSGTAIIDHILTNSDATDAAYRDLGHTADPSAGVGGELYYNTTSKVYKFYNGTVWAELGGGGGSGDMILAAAQTVTGAKTFQNTTLVLKNTLNTFTGTFSHTSTLNAVWTLPATSQVLVGRTTTDTLTNKIMDGDLNTFLDINETQMKVSVGASGTVLTSNGVNSTPTYQSGGGAGDMILAATQTVTGLKTFLNATLGLRNALNTQTGSFTHNSLLNPTWILPPTSQTLVGQSLSQPLTNKTMDGDLNTFIDINETQMKVLAGASGTVLTSNGVNSTPTYQIGGGGGADTDLGNLVTTSIKKALIFTTVDGLSASQQGIALDSTNVIEINAITQFKVTISGATKFTVGSTGWGPLVSTNTKLFVSSSGAAAPINIQARAGTPSTKANGDIWYTTDSGHTLFGRINGADVDLGAGGGGPVNLDGIQDFEIWQLQNTSQFTHDVYMTNSKSGTTANGGTGVSLNQDVGWWVPIYIAKRSRILRMGLEITGGASPTSNVVMGIYSNRTDGQNYPLTRLVQSSALLSNTASAQIISIPATNLEVGLYWLVVASTSGNLNCIFTLEGESNCVGYQLNTVGTDHFDAILGYTSVQSSTTLPITAPNNMDIANTLGTGIPMVFAIFNANTS